jgi:hypothetical protein
VKEAPLPCTKNYNPVGSHKDYSEDHLHASEPAS